MKVKVQKGMLRTQKSQTNTNKPETNANKLAHKSSRIPTTDPLSSKYPNQMQGKLAYFQGKKKSSLREKEFPAVSSRVTYPTSKAEPIS